MGGWMGSRAGVISPKCTVFNFWRFLDGFQAERAYNLLWKPASTVSPQFYKIPTNFQLQMCSGVRKSFLQQFSGPLYSFERKDNHWAHFSQFYLLFKGYLLKLVSNPLLPITKLMSIWPFVSELENQMVQLTRNFMSAAVSRCEQTIFDLCITMWVKVVYFIETLLLGQ